MSKFLTPLRVRELEDASHDGRGTWRLEAALIYDSDVAKRVFVVPAGFVTDYASVPRIPVAFLLAGDTAHEAAVVHDWLYTSHQVDRATADAVLREAAIASGVPPWRAQVMWLGVRAGGASHWDQPGQVQPMSVGVALSKAAPGA